jgi:SAM-dependent methyltransferase
MTEAPRHSYDHVPYRSAPEPLAHPPRLETLAALSGMSPAPVSNARILELGCGTGANLLPLALEYPRATIVGCDLSARAIATAQQLTTALALTNLEFRQADLASVSNWGQFDYILCHDVYSAVTPELQQVILRIMADHLAPQGVGYLSHDALPGWHLHDVALDMMRHHTRQLAGSLDRVSAAREILAQAAETHDQEQTAYAAVIRDQYWLFGSIPDNHLYHLLEGPHQAFYHHEMLERLAFAGLRWLRDAGHERARPLTESVRRTVDQLSSAERPQYLDWVTNRSLRRAVVCRQDTSLGREDDVHVIRQFWIGLSRSALLAVTADSATLGRPGEAPLHTSDPSLMTAMQALDRSRPALLELSRLVDPANEAAVSFMLDAVNRGTMEAVLSPPALSGEIEDRPLASPLARLQALEQTTVTNRLAAPVHLGAATRFVLQLSDGTRDRTALVHAIDAERESASRSAQAGALGGLTISAAEIAELSLEEIRDLALLVSTPR